MPYSAEEIKRMLSTGAEFIPLRAILSDGQFNCLGPTARLIIIEQALDLFATDLTPEQKARLPRLLSQEIDE